MFFELSELIVIVKKNKILYNNSNFKHVKLVNLKIILQKFIISSYKK